MLPDPIVGQHYGLTHKNSKSNPFRGYVQIAQKGWISNLLIFRTSITGNTWFYWDDYDFHFIGDLA